MFLIRTKKKSEKEKEVSCDRPEQVLNQNNHRRHMVNYKAVDGDSKQNNVIKLQPHALQSILSTYDAVVQPSLSHM